MKKFKWQNIPIPPQHFVGLLIGATLHLFLPQRLYLFSLEWVFFGLVFVSAGIWICWKSTLEAGEMIIARPGELLTTGPYSYSRNPMYMGWLILYLGFAIAIGSVWIYILFPIVLVYTHFFDIKKEEQQLKAKFGDSYLKYQMRVRRYI